MAKRNKADLAIEELAFREAVQDYLKTGQSSLLTTKEKTILDKARPKITCIAKPSFLSQILAWFKN
jgi:hypothetical protein